MATAAFVGVNIGGSSTGVAFGPATGSGVLSMRWASGLMAVFVLLGGATVGTNVVHTLGEGFVPSEYFTPAASIAVLLFIGCGILLGNVLRVSVSTSETAVLGVVGMGAALGVLNWETVGTVVMWWFISPILAFWVCGFIGRYLYDDLVAVLDTEFGELGGGLRFLVIAIGCYMAFSAGASNVANAVAPLVGSGQIGMTGGVALGGLEIGVGAFVLGPRTMETVGEEITDLTLEASLIVEIVAATIIVSLSYAGIPASLAITLTSCVIGLGWGRASRRIPLWALATSEEFSDKVRPEWVEDQLELYDPKTTKRILVTWIASPTLAGVAAYGVFLLLRQFNLIVP
ncbi:MAG: anion permease [Salinibacter sp.]